MSTSPLPSISTGRGETLSRPFGPPSRGIPFSNNLSPSAASNPMAIRGVDYSDVPPPLPPPRLVPINGPVDPNLQFKESMRRDDYGSPDTDSLGHSFRRRDLSFRSDVSDDGYHSLDSFRFVLTSGDAAIRLTDTAHVLGLLAFLRLGLVSIP